MVHRELILKENGIKVTSWTSQHNDTGKDMVEKDLLEFVKKIEETKKMDLMDVFYSLLSEEILKFRWLKRH